MNRRKFLKTSSVTVAAAVASPVLIAEATQVTLPVISPERQAFRDYFNAWAKAGANMPRVRLGQMIVRGTGDHETVIKYLTDEQAQIYKEDVNRHFPGCHIANYIDRNDSISYIRPVANGIRGTESGNQQLFTAEGTDSF